jgi:hypothetical protein
LNFSSAGTGSNPTIGIPSSIVAVILREEYKCLTGCSSFFKRRKKNQVNFATVQQRFLFCYGLDIFGGRRCSCAGDTRILPEKESLVTGDLPYSISSSRDDIMLVSEEFHSL